MKIIKNNFSNVKEVEQKEKEVVCEHCDSIFEYDNEDIEVGAYGMGYVKCPCCNKDNYLAELSEVFELTKDNLRFPIHYNHNDGVKMEDERIDKWVKHCIENFDKNDDNDWVKYTSCGDTIVFVFRLKEDNEYEIYVCKNYYETFLEIK